MRFRKIDRYLLLLAGLFVVAVLIPRNLPGEEVLPDVYRATIYRPFLAQAAAAAAKDELELVRLRSELEAARREAAMLKQQIDDLHQLRGYFEKLEWTAPPLALPGWVFSVEADQFRRTFTVDVGTKRGVEAGMPVVIGKALLGIVLSAKAHQAVVRRVDDPRFTIEVEVETEEGSFTGIARGNGDKGLELRFLRRTDALKPGAPVFTSSYHEKIPPGLLVGWVEAMQDPDKDGVVEVTVRPAASMKRLAQIDVVKRLKRR